MSNKSNQCLRSKFSLYSLMKIWLMTTNMNIFRWILTAAHCTVRENPNSLWVRIFLIHHNFVVNLYLWLFTEITYLWNYLRQLMTDIQVIILLIFKNILFFFFFHLPTTKSILFLDLTVIFHYSLIVSLLQPAE